MFARGRTWRHNWQCEFHQFWRAMRSKASSRQDEHSAGLVIAWRNPRPVQIIQRCTRVSENSCYARYFVEELIGGAQEGLWIDSSTMEILYGGNTPESCEQERASNSSRRTEPERKTPASRAERKVSSSAALAPLIGLWRDVYSCFEE
jgi:hypothetical protein